MDYADRPLLAQLWGLRDAGGMTKRVDPWSFNPKSQHQQPEALLAAAKHYGIEVPMGEAA